MRRVWMLILCLALLTTAVSAAGTVTKLQSNAVLTTDGACEISVVLHLSMDGTESNLRYPLPANARDITLNGDRVKAEQENSRQWVDLSDEIRGAGSYTLTLQYALPDLVKEEKSGMVLTLPLLSGFEYPIGQMEFSITLPGAPEEEPVFSSTWHQESTEFLMDYTVEGQVISGHFLQELKDHETLTMTLQVSKEMFPGAVGKHWSLSNDDLLQYGLTLLAAVYWLLFLRCPRPHGLRRVQAPDGITAGELGCCLSGLGVDFSVMVLSWAQMGYLTIQVDRSGRVLLHKIMDMGNERSQFEMRTFKKLFGRRQTVDGRSEHYVGISRKAGKSVPGAWHYFKKHTGNPILFRGIAAGIGAVAGYSLAVAMVGDGPWQVVLSVLLVPLCAYMSWLIQSMSRGIHLRHKMDVLIGTGCCLVWLLLGLLTGESLVAIFVILTQLSAGVAVIHGGRRTEAGLQARNEILGLRRYLRTISSEELGRIQENNPDYYFAMLPDAMALGVDKAFARHFGGSRVGACPYLELEGSQNMTAKQWNDQMRKVIQVLDNDPWKLMWKKLFGK